ncbi:DUF1648 domain-containing protein [Rhodococcus spongiicola]|uniref:DUF1648 domain-containing protein n=1 Tax=Rhodococcus spongiicola TaxID=2487352 RepID=A0A3S3AJX0_9NOCA|nr:DUF1648 domain-containing protein [Rhodococcus spongiicola]RVW02367.1 DUF1648 domain-containing protein [Rhodococcus spongiicola]
MTTPPPGPRVVDHAGAIFGLVVPVLAAAAGVVVTYVLEPRLPERIATPWSGSAPEALVSPTTSAWSLAAIVLIVGGGCCAIAALAQARLMMRRVMLLLGLTIVGGLLAAAVATTVGQLDAVAVVDTPLPVGAIGLGLAVGAVVGLVGASLLRDHRVRTSATEAPAADLPRGIPEMPITDQVGMRAGELAATGVALVAPAALVCWLANAWWPLGMYLPFVLLAMTILQFRLVVDAESIRVQNMGMSAIEYGTDEVLGAKVTHVRPFQDFGGWGLKSKGRGDQGVVTRTGPAVVITFACGDRLTVTTPRAEEIAGALNTLADQRLTRS